MKTLLLVALSCAASGVAAPMDIGGSGQPAPAAGSPLRTRDWAAKWIVPPSAPKNEYGVFLFRKELVLATKPTRFVVHVAADARYRFYVNGTSVSFGPQRSDAWVWHYDSVDLAPWLQAGANILAAEVWSYGEWSPYAITSVRTGLLVQGDGELEQSANTGASWTVARDAACEPLPLPELRTYLVVGTGEKVNAAMHPWGWQRTGLAAAGFVPAREMTKGNPYGWSTDMDHWLAPRTIPAMEETPTRFARVRRAEGVSVPEGFVAGRTPLVVPARTKATVLLDQGYETSAFPQLVVSGGRGAVAKLTYAEALFDDGWQKGNRDEVEGRHILGIADEFYPDGAEGRRFSPLNFRTYRYVQLDVTTGAESLTVQHLSGVFTGYPFRENGGFKSDDASLAKIWEVGWRTARLCAFETYVDCPYYEQLQYVGDTRIQALISLYVSGDDRLMRNAIELYDRSRIAEGLTQSRYPSTTPQVINTFSLWWVEMVHDYWMHRTDDAFVRERLPGIEAVLGWFERRIDAKTGLLGPLQYWTFVDWTKEWPWNSAAGIGGEPAGAREGGSSIVSLQLAVTLTHAAEVCRASGREDLAARYEKLAGGLRAAVVATCWDSQRKLFADTPEKRHFSQHANALAVLGGAVTGDAAKDLIRRVTADESLVQASTYFRFYLLRAMKAAGLGDEYLNQLGPWRTMLARGLTTFAEQPDPTRSDCHAWSASPVYELLATVCGVEPAAPGFARVRVEPHLGALQHAEGVVAHPAGFVRVKIEKIQSPQGGEAIKAWVSLPAGVSGEFVWKGKVLGLVPGEQTVSVE